MEKEDDMSVKETQCRQIVMTSGFPFYANPFIYFFVCLQGIIAVAMVRWGTWD